MQKSSYRILRIVLLLLLIKLILSWGGIGNAASAIPAVGGSSVAPSQVVEDFDQAKEFKVLREGRQYAKDTGRRVEGGKVEAWYDAGAKSVWFEVTRDINGKGDAYLMYVELPDDPAARAKCYDIARQYYAENQHADPASLIDSGEPYMKVRMP